MAGNGKGLSDLVIYGASGLGREILALIQRDYAEVWRVAGFIDNNPNLPKEVDGVPLLPASYLENEETAIVLGFSDTKGKSNLFSKLRERPNLSFPNIISRHAIVAPSARMGIANVIQDLCWISTNATIGSGILVNVAATVGHDAVIEDCCSIMPQCAISGNVRIGRETLIGANSFILQGKRIGQGATVVAGSSVFRDVGDGESVWGNPARRLPKS